MNYSIYHAEFLQRLLYESKVVCESLLDVKLLFEKPFFSRKLLKKDF